MNKYPITIETLSPLHIGKGNALTSVGEYVATDKTIRILDQKHLYELLKEKNLMQDYMNYILDYAKNTYVWDFFKENGIEKELNYTREFALNADAFNPVSNNILELATETCGQKYIPGSSLKGAIRTMVFAYHIETDDTLKSEVERIILDFNNLYDIRKRIDEKEDKLLNKVFGHLIVLDSELVPDKEVTAEISKRVHLFGEKTDGLDNLRECIVSGTKIKTTLSVKNSAVDNSPAWIYGDDLERLFDAINKIMVIYLDYEIRLLSGSSEIIAKEMIKSLQALKNQVKDFGNDKALLRLGKGKTFIFQIILPLLNNAAQKKLLQLMIKDEDVRNNFPKTRVLNDYNEMFGWIKIIRPATPVVKVNYLNNKVETLIVKETELVARYVDLKRASLMLNGVLIENIQLVNQFETKFEIGTSINVFVWQLTKDGRLNQVKLINKL